MSQRMRCLLVAVAASAGLLSTLGVQAAAGTHPTSEPITLTILHTNDVHSHVDEWTTGGITVGGAARMATEIRRIRASEPNVLLLDAGDQFQGTLFYSYYKSQVITATMNALAYDAMTIGNHEFDDGPAELARFIGGAEFPVLGANIEVRSASSPLFGRIAPTTVITIGGRPIGLLGLTTTETPEISSPGEDIAFADSAETARQAVADFAERGIDVVIALTHLGYENDLALARSVDGLDVIVGGHSHTFLYTPSDDASGPYPTVVTQPDGKRALVVTAGEWGHYLGHLTVSFDGAGAVADYSGNPIVLDAQVGKDPALEALIAAYRQPLDAFSHTVIGESALDIPIRAGDDQLCRIGECTMGDLVADATFERADELAPGLDLAVLNGGGLRAPIASGPVTIGDVMEVLPFGNTLATFSITGTYLLAALENGLGQFPEQSGRFPQVAGLQLEWDPERSPGSRLTSLEVWDASAGQFVPLDPTKVYRVATNDYLRRGGDGYEVFRDHAIDPYDFGPPLDQVLIDYIGAHSPIAPFLDGRIQRFGSRVFLPLTLQAGEPYLPPEPPPMGDTEYAILRTVIEDGYPVSERLERYVIRSEAGMPFVWGDEAVPCQALSEGLAGLRSETCADFAARNSRPIGLEDRFLLPRPVVLLSAEEQNELFRSGGDGWERFRERYPNAQGIMDLARPGISADGAQALAYAGNQVDWLAGAGFAYLLQRSGDAWLVIAAVMLWIS